MNGMLRKVFLPLFLLMGMLQIQALESLEIDQFKVLAHQLELQAAVLNRDMSCYLGGNPHAKYFLQFLEEFAIGCTRLHKLSNQWYVTGTGLGLRMDSLEYLAKQIQFAAAYTQADMTDFRRQWAALKITYRQIQQIYYGKFPGGNGPAMGGGASPIPGFPGDGKLPYQPGSQPGNGPVVMPNPGGQPMPTPPQGPATPAY